MVLFCVALLCSVVPRKAGCKDLTPIERGVADAMNGMLVTSGKMKKKLGATHIAKGLKRSRQAVQKYISKKTHVKPRGGPRCDYEATDVDTAVKANGYSRCIRFVIRTSQEGLVLECTKAGPKHTPGANGEVNVFAAIFRGRVIVWKAYKRW